MPARLFSHRCTQKIEGIYNVNKIQACIVSLEHGYEGIEVDFQYYNGSFYMNHDDYSLTNETMDMLFSVLSNKTYSIWIDLKTSTRNDGQLQKLYELLSRHNMLDRCVVELYNTSLKIPKGIKTTSCYYPYDGILCRRGYQISIHDISKTTPIYVWDETSAKDPCILHELNEKDVILQAYDFPRPYVCNDHPNIWIVVVILFILLLTVRLR